ncbi:TonB family protein [Pontiellaceae bacterium B12219]|nr:TonB family protein [Pontiellaceae bacterium B12219]
MQKRKSIINIPLLGGIILSIALHAVALYSRGIQTPAKPQLEAGRTVVQLTLLPSIEKKAAPPVSQPAPEPQPETEIEPEPQPETRPEPSPAPIPEPIIDPIPQPNPENEPIQETTPEPAAEESAEQIASQVEDKGVQIEAAPVSGIRATYPRSSQKRGHQGTVTLSIQVLPNGKAGQVKVITSSGFSRLDDAAVKAAKEATYIPAQQFGRNVESELIQPVTFKLTP